MDRDGLYVLANRLDSVISKMAGENLRRNTFGYLLACTRALAAVAQSYHWRTKGGHYYGDHLLYERIYGEVNDMIDGLAEKGIGVSDDDELAEVNNQTKLVAEITTKHAPEDTKEEDFPKVLLEYSKHRVEMIGDMLEKLRDANESSDGIENMLQGFADTHEAHVYLLQRRVKEASVKEQDVKDYFQKHDPKTPRVNSWRFKLKEM